MPKSLSHKTQVLTGVRLSGNRRAFLPQRSIDFWEDTFELGLDGRSQVSGPGMTEKPAVQMKECQEHSKKEGCGPCEWRRGAKLRLCLT